jgi:hypothetical protein
MSDKPSFTSAGELAKSVDIGVRAPREQDAACDPPTEHRCDFCDGTGWEPVHDDRGVHRVRRCSCWKAGRPKAAPGVPVDLQDATLANYIETASNRHAVKAARQWVSDPKRDVYLCGGVGVGKTRLAVSMLNAMFRARHGGYFMRVPMFLLKLQPSSGEQSSLFTLACTTAVLVLDDVGAERESATDFTRRTLLTLYDDRGDRGLPTIWTGNKSLAELGDFMQDERLSSRIAGRAEVLEVVGDDWRVSRRAR